MPAPCSSCHHPEREAIDAALVEGRDSLRSLARRFGVDRASLSRHKQHIGPELVRVMTERAGAGPATALDRYERLYVAVSEAVYGAERLPVPLVREARQLLDSIAKVRGELDVDGKVQILNYTDPMWSGIEQALTAAGPSLCPDCRSKVGLALRSLPTGGVA